ncbi:MAG: hypothetical protein A2W25_02900 [candidate division Zixibacteria bacterium RBG_16_53_22]|nr:MAG: hypothetical protein A2W25_02900 [candidate division Zixibacteria bacterium RBG_16_53_22]
MKVREIKSITASILILALISTNVAFAGAPQLVSRKAPASDTDGIVARVLDGDTFVLSDNRRLRLIGVDTPERGEPYADIAREFADSVLTGKSVKIENDRMRLDRYDRILGYVFVDTVFFNELLIGRGLAHVYLFKENKRYSKRLIRAQSEARRRKIGIWSLPTPVDEKYYVSAGGSYRFHRPLCTLIKHINPRKAKKHKDRDSALEQGLSPCRECRP